MDLSESKYLDRFIPAGRRLSLIPPIMGKKERGYILVSSLSEQYIKVGAGYLLVGSGVSYNQLLDFIINSGYYIELVRPPNIYESLGGLFSNSLLIDLSIDGSVKPYEAFGSGSFRIYRNFLVRYRDTPLYTSFEYSVDSLDMLRDVVGLARSYCGEGGAHIIYYTGGGYRLRLIVQRGLKKGVSEALSNMKLDWGEVGVYDEYYGLVEPSIFCDEWGSFYISLFVGVEPGALLLVVRDGVIYFGDFSKKIYLVFSRAPVEGAEPVKSVYYDDGVYTNY